MNTNDFESNVKTIINALGFNAYQNKAPNKAVMPYVVFRFDTVLDLSTCLINSILAYYIRKMYRLRATRLEQI